MVPNGSVMLPATSMLCYVGPGAALSAIGAFLALLAAAVCAVVGFVWYPLKRLLRRRRGAPAAVEVRSSRP
ncbi:MAG: hypothetical protein JNK49_00235 [Planctomycetes bacterium]|nr:hypothetical protein [Planctomycetota bacterium]